MRHPAVHWFEGLFLQPHHLQASERHWAESLTTSERWDHAYYYGLRRLELSEEAIANHQLQVNVCHARLPDGTLVEADASTPLDRVDLKPAFEKTSSVRVYLAVPKLALGRANVAPPPGKPECRFVEEKRSVEDENEGGNDQELAFRRLNVRLLLSTDELEGYEVLPIAQLERAGEKEAAPQLDVSYIPPLLAIDAWPPLGRDVVRAIYDLAGKKIEVLSQQVVSRGITLVSQEPGDLDRLLMLSQLNAAYAVLEVLAFAQGVHPFAAYAELCRLVGQLSLFGPERRPPEIPHYDHDDLGRIFAWVKRQIAWLLEQVRDYEYEQRFFVGRGRGMHVSLDPKWLGGDWQWFVGVQCETLSREQCLELLSPGKLDWKLGSARQVDALFEYGAEGLQLRPLAQAPRALPPSRDWVYYEVVRQNQAWKDVLETQTLAMRLKDALIVNAEQLEGRRKLVVSYEGGQAPLHFALFAVPLAS